MSDFTALFWDNNFVCIGEAGEGLSEYFEGFTMSEELKKDFYTWHDEFEEYADKKPCPIDWKKYNLRGLELTKRLQIELGKDIEVVYKASYRSEPYFNLTKESPVVNFLQVDLGMLEFTMKAGHQNFESRFSSVYDPLPKFLHWLEALAIGVQQASFWYEPEGTDIKFDIERWSYDSDVLTISEKESKFYDNEEVKIFVFCKVNRKQFVNEVYWGLRNFSASDEFKKNGWDENYVEMGYSESCSKISDFKSELIEKYLSNL